MFFNSLMSCKQECLSLHNLHTLTTRMRDCSLIHVKSVQRAIYDIAERIAEEIVKMIILKDLLDL